MGRRLIVDTNILIEIERGNQQIEQLFASDDDIAIAAVTRAELRMGALITESVSLKAQRLNTVAAIIRAVETLSYDEDTADAHAELLAYVRKTGTPRGAHDLIIAAHARCTRRLILTLDSRARFGDLPGVNLAVSPSEMEKH